MNKVILLGRLTKDPEVRYSQGAEPIAVARYTLAVNRRLRREGEAEADFINCIAFGKSGEFAEKYFKKGQMVAVVGRLQVSSYTDKAGNKRLSTDVVIEEQHFAESKSSFEANRGSANSYGNAQKSQASSAPANSTEDFFSIDENIDDEDLPF